MHNVKYKIASSGKSTTTTGNPGQEQEHPDPPALVRLKGGRLCLVYGNRTKRQMLARLSRDQGRTWGKEILLRDDYLADSFNDADFGYPRVVQRADGKLVVMYYWATKQNPHHHIAGTIWDPDVIK